MDWIRQIAPKTPLTGPTPRRSGGRPTSSNSPSGSCRSNHDGTLFGPNALALLGKAAFLVAARTTRQSVAMAAASQIDFLAPVCP